MSVQTRQAGGCTVVDVIGRMTIDSSPDIRPVLHVAVESATSARVVVDLTKVSFVDTSAIATLIEVATLARQRRIRLCVIGLTGEPRLLAEIIELGPIFRSLGSDVEVV